MDEVDRKISDFVQRNGRASNAEIAEVAGVSVSTANERLRRLAGTGVVSQWRGVLDPQRVGAGLCVFVMIDMAYDGEEQACERLCQCDEVQELHHISGPHSYLMKVRVADTRALQDFIQTVVKPMKAVLKTETLVSLSTQKETSVVSIPVPYMAGG
ncbi:Lrp/AsnC family transcriptional regulator [Kiloniella sp. b19]|uniref:Lrp/AsnC family transcriptional regulator n=1 Tax=Kiloniella sp. GXU_MW_B19 TaxID=3141326 RepID=UPI0031D5B437